MMILIFVFNFCLALIYLMMLGHLTNIWEQTEDTLLTKDFKSKFTFDIILPYRDEAKCISDCINSLLAQRSGSPIFKIIAVNDGSTDQGPKKLAGVDDHRLVMLTSTSHGKKQALTQGIQAAAADYIITVDADCTFHPDWLSLIDQHLQQSEVDALVAPVSIAEDNSHLTRFQYMDMASTMALTLTGIKDRSFYLANGANFIFKKSVFNDVKGYQGNEHIASGDDVFLLKKIVESHKSVSFIKSNRAAARTSPVTTWLAFFHQRKRWATKSMAYATTKLLMIQGLVFGFSMLLLIECFVLPILWQPAVIMLGLFLWFMKGIIDYMFLSRLVAYFDGKKVLKSFIYCTFLYPIYYLAIGVNALIPSHTTWKGRNVG